MAEAMVVGSSLSVFAAVAGGACGLWLWANAVARKHSTRFYNPARWLPRIGTALLVVSFLVTTAGLVRSFGAIAEAETTSKATALARGISTATNYGAGPGALGALLLIVSAVLSTAGTLQRSASEERG